MLVAIDDMQWLDAPSADALAFAARRLRRATRSRSCSPAAPAAGRRSSARSTRGRLQRLDVGPLELGRDPARCWPSGSALSLPRPLLRRVVEATLGNPLFALEVGRALAERAAPAGRADSPCPSAVEDLLGTRVAALPDAGAPACCSLSR